MKFRVCAGAAILVFAARAAEAHVKIRPIESNASVTETYTVLVPTEGKVATTSVDLEVPKDMAIVSVEGAKASYDVKKTASNISVITWRVNIAPGEHQEFVFVAKNPSGGEISWKAHQHFADGSVADWVEAPGSKRPGPVTKIVPASTPK